MDGQGQQQGGGQQGQQQDSGQQQGGQQGTQQQAQGRQQNPQGQQTPPVDTDAIAAAARRDGDADGYSRAARELGVSIDDAKQILADAKKRSDAEKTAEQRLSERDGELATAKEESSNHKKRADRYEKIVKARVEAQLEAINDDAIKDLLSGFDVAGQFEWLTKHGAKYIKAPEGQQDDSQQQGDDQLRGPDATRKDRIPGLDDANQNFNDILRERGLSGGVSLQ
jgi:hypothetical protein